VNVAQEFEEIDSRPPTEARTRRAVATLPVGTGVVSASRLHYVEVTVSGGRRVVVGDHDHNKVHRVIALKAGFAVALLGALIGAGWATASKSVNPPIVLVSAPAHTGWHVPSSSMEPTLHCAKPGAGCLGRHPDWPVISAIHGTPPRGNIVAFKTPPLAMLRCGSGGVFIKRVIALPGEKWSEKNGYVYINGKRLREPYVTASRRDLRTVQPVTIPRDHYFVLGDNRSASCDSRAWGTVPRSDIIGEVTRVYREK
jgi:signal peptidase I